MTLQTYEGVVQKGSILLDESVQLPENAKVYIVVAEEIINITLAGKKSIQILSPQFVNREDAKHFTVTVAKEESDA